MVFSNVLNQVAVLLLIMLTGFYSGKRNIMGKEVNKKLSELLLKITNPLLVISSFQTAFQKELMISVAIVFIFAVCAHIASALLGMLLFHKFGDARKKIMKFSAIYSNCGFVGFPILGSLFGNLGVLLGSVYVAVFNIFLWTNGVMIFSSVEKQSKKMYIRAFANPGIFSVLIGLILFVFSLQLPYAITAAVQLVGSMTVPLSMLIVGANIAACRLSTLFKGMDLFFASAVRLLVLPLLAFFILKLLGFSDMLLSTCVLLVAMPAAATTAIFTEMYEGDTSFAARVVALSTLLSLITVPLIILFLQ